MSFHFVIHGRSSAGRAVVSKTKGREFESYRPCKFTKKYLMEKFTLYVKESYNELVNKVTWPNMANLQSSTILVLVASLMIALVVFVMDLISKQALDIIYSL